VRSVAGVVLRVWRNTKLLPLLETLVKPGLKTSGLVPSRFSTELARPSWSKSSSAAVRPATENPEIQLAKVAPGVPVW
jgi:hypothetical protein